MSMQSSCSLDSVSPEAPLSHSDLLPADDPPSGPGTEVALDG